MWNCKFLSKAKLAGYDEVLTGKQVTPDDSEALDLRRNEDKVKAKLRKMNIIAYNALMLSCEGGAFGPVEEAKTTKHPDGDARQAWVNLLEKYQVETAAGMVQLRMDFTKCVMKNESQDPDEWFTELEYLKQRLKGVKVNIEESELIAHILNNLPNNYSELVTSVEGDVDKLKMKTLRESVRAFYRRKVIKNGLGKNDDNEEDDENVALFTKQGFKGRCRKCGVFGHKAAECNKTGKEKPHSGAGSVKKCFSCGKM
jgi:hypothetical protein